MNEQEPNLPEHRLWQPTTAKWFFVVFGGSVLYAVIRYHIAGDVEWRHFPACPGCSKPGLIPDSQHSAIRW